MGETTLDAHCKPSYNKWGRQSSADGALRSSLLSVSSWRCWTPSISPCRPSPAASPPSLLHLLIHVLMDFLCHSVGGTQVMIFGARPTGSVLMGLHRRSQGVWSLCRNHPVITHMAGTVSNEQTGLEMLLSAQQKRGAVAVRLGLQSEPVFRHPWKRPAGSFWKSAAAKLHP